MENEELVISWATAYGVEVEDSVENEDFLSELDF